MKKIIVTAALIENNGKILIAKRKHSFCGNPAWEFPGGKLELGESLQQCLAREIAEEFNIKISVENFIDKSSTIVKNHIIELHAFKCKIKSGKISPKEHEKIAFVLPENFLDYNLMPADIPIAKKFIGSTGQISIYVHIPFCEKKCAYCNFPSFANKNHLIENYFRALEKEILGSSFIQKNYLVNSIFFGGGTPSFVPPESLAHILKIIRKNFNVEKNAEISVECNPNSITKKFTETMLAAGVNRFSVGVQSLNNDELKTLGRLHNSAQAFSALKILRAAGAKNISLDFICGIPGQSVSSLKNSLQTAVQNFKPEHISLYSLSVERGTPLARKKLDFPDDDFVAEQLRFAEKFLKKYDFHKYEISNFAKNNFFSIHNLSYWNTKKSYIGFGAAAHSFCQPTARSAKKRFRNIKSPEKYIQKILNKKTHKFFSKILTHKQQVGEKIFLGLRLINGIKLSPDEFLLFKKEIEEQINLGLIKKSKNYKIALTKRGLEIANTVMNNFV